MLLHIEDKIKQRFNVLRFKNLFWTKCILTIISLKISSALHLCDLHFFIFVLNPLTLLKTFGYFKILILKKTVSPRHSWHITTYQIKSTKHNVHSVQFWFNQFLSVDLDIYSIAKKLEQDTHKLPSQDQIFYRWKPATNNAKEKNQFFKIILF